MSIRVFLCSKAKQKMYREHFINEIYLISDLQLKIKLRKNYNQKLIVPTDY